MRAYRVDRIGMKFGGWTVIRDAGYVGTNRYYLCECFCGRQKNVSLANLMSGRTISCLCIGRGMIAAVKTKHGMAGTRQHKIWKGMLQRCNNPNNPAYCNYGQRGITVCDEWYSFESFWADMKEGYRDDLTLERIDNDKGYSSDNCTWIPLAAQRYNRRDYQIVKEID